MNSLTKTLLTGSLCLLVQTVSSCQKKKHYRDKQLERSYTLTYYESARSDKFVILLNDKTVVPPQVESVGHDPRYIWGVFNSIKNPAFDDVPNGYFVITLET